KSGVPLNRRLFEDKLMLIKKKNSPQLYGAIERLLENRNILESASNYVGFQVRLTGIYLNINEPDDPDWRDHFSDIGFPDPATAYMHLDSSVQWIKCLLYLTYVDKDNGPFSYVIGSNKWNTGFFDSAIRRANDRAGLDKCDPKTRQLFSALPKFLQKKS